MKPDGTAYDNILVKRNMDGVDAMQGIETLTSLALAEYWDAPNGEKNMDDDDYDCENENIVAKAECCRMGAMCHMRCGRPR